MPGVTGEVTVVAVSVWLARALLAPSRPLPLPRECHEHPTSMLGFLWLLDCGGNGRVSKALRDKCPPPGGRHSRAPSDPSAPALGLDDRGAHPSVGAAGSRAAKFAASHVK